MTMSLFDSLTAGQTVANLHESNAATIEALGTELVGAESTIDFLQESLADVQLALEDVGWQRLSMWADLQFTREGLRQSAVLCRTMAVVNPLIRRGLALRTAYVWGGGVEIAARATGEEAGEQDVNAVVQAFIDDRGNRKVLTGAQARERNERTLGTDGNQMFALPTNPRTGRVQVRRIPFDEVQEIIYNPEDRTEPWFYKRVHTVGVNSVTTYYPDIDYQPRGARATRIGGAEVAWDKPVIHLKVNDLDDWDFGIGDAFAAIFFARAYKEGLEDWAKLVKALSRFAWRATADRKSKAQTAATKAAALPTVNPRTGDPLDVGAFVSMGPGQSLEAIPKTGATIDSEAFRPIAAMVASAMDVPVTMLLGDPGTTGARATAETLDRPTELMAQMRREVWTEFLTRILDYVIDQAVKAPAGPLQGTITRDDNGREVITLGGETERTVEIDWPELEDVSIDTIMGALEKADGIGVLPPLEMLKLILKALRVKDADEIVKAMTDPNTGEFIDPQTTAGDVAVQQFRQGQDPAAAVQ